MLPINRGSLGTYRYQHASHLVQRITGACYLVGFSRILAAYPVAGIIVGARLI